MRRRARMDALAEACRHGLGDVVRALVVRPGDEEGACGEEETKTKVEVEVDAKTKTTSHVIRSLDRRCVDHVKGEGGEGEGGEGEEGEGGEGEEGGDGEGEASQEHVSAAV